MDANILLNNIIVNVDKKQNKFIGHALLNDTEVCRCVVDYDNTGWAIASWYTDHSYMHKGIGTKTLSIILKELYKTTGMPENVQYIWNGANEYVYDWLTNNFDAVCQCPISIQKYLTEDDWSAHVYNLNVDKVINYFNILE